MPSLLILPTKARILCLFRFIIEYIYSSLMDFGPLGNNNNNRSNFYLRIFLKDDILACVETWDY